MSEIPFLDLSEWKSEVTAKLREVVFEDGRNIVDSGSIVKIDIDNSGKVSVMLKLD